MRWKALVSLALAAVMTGCAAGLSPPPVPPVPPAASPAPDGREDAEMIVQDVVRARVTATLHVERVAHRRFAPALVRFAGLEAALAGTGIDPLRHVRRAFLAAHTSILTAPVVVVQHTAGEALVRRSLGELHRSFLAATPPVADARRDVSDAGAAGSGRRITRVLEAFPDPSRYPFAAAYKVVDKAFSGAPGPVLIAAPRPGLLVVLPPEQVIAAFRMAEGAGLRPPVSDEAIVVRAWDPRSSVPWDLVWWGDIRYAEAAIAFEPGGGGVIRLRARCSSAEGARAQAIVMTAQLEQAQTLPIGGLRLFDAIELRALGDRVTMRAHLLAQDLDWLAAMLAGP